MVIEAQWAPSASGRDVVARVHTSDGDVARYQVPITRDERAADPDVLYVDADGGRWVDALSRPAGILAYGELFAANAVVPVVDGEDVGAPSPDLTFGPLEFHGIGDAFEPAPDTAAPLGVEQSNTSVVIDDRILVKFFRRLSEGENPDVEIHRALGALGCPYVAALRGWIQTTIDGRPVTMAMAQDLVAGAVDGWSVALDALRGDDAARRAFVASAANMGVAVAGVHRDLRRSLGGSDVDAAELTAGLAARIDRQCSRTVSLRPYAQRARELVTSAAGAGVVPVHRVHGDLHLGQVLGSGGQWVVIDFEGEPATDPEERRAPDSPLRDVACMLRSFDYAAAVADAGPTGTAAARAAAGAFCDGYAREAGVDPRVTGALLAAYELDKAVYEVDYEARNRPDWVGVPMAAVERILGG